MLSLLLLVALRSVFAHAPVILDAPTPLPMARHVADSQKSFAFYAHLRLHKPAFWVMDIKSTDQVAVQVFRPVLAEYSKFKWIAWLMYENATQTTESAWNVIQTIHPQLVFDQADITRLNTTLRVCGIYKTQNLTTKELEPFSPSAFESLLTLRFASMTRLLASNASFGATVAAVSAAAATAPHHGRFWWMLTDDPAAAVAATTKAVALAQTRGVPVGFVTGYKEEFSFMDLLSLPVTIMQVHLWDDVNTVVLILPLVLGTLLTLLLVLYTAYFTHTARRHARIWHLLAAAASCVYLGFVLYVYACGITANRRLDAFSSQDADMMEAQNIMSALVFSYLLLALVPMLPLMILTCCCCSAKSDRYLLAWWMRLLLVAFGISTLFIFGMGLYLAPLLLVLGVGCMPTHMANTKAFSPLPLHPPPPPLHITYPGLPPKPHHHHHQPHQPHLNTNQYMHMYPLTCICILSLMLAACVVGIDLLLFYTVVD